MTTVLGCTPESAAPAADAGTLSSEFDGAPAADASPGADATPCAAPVVESWSGTGSRDNDDGYPDHITATVTWTRTGTAGCVDTYTPSGSTLYGYAIPGAQCAQSIDPETYPVAAADGTLTVDRSTAPAIYAGSGATYWTFTFHCVYQDGTYDDSQMPGGAAWFDGSGTVAAGAIAGSYFVDGDDQGASQRCGPNGIAPCAYDWSFSAD